MESKRCRKKQQMMLSNEYVAFVGRDSGVLRTTSRLHVAK